MKNQIRIAIQNVQEFTAVIAGLTRENLAYEAELVGNDWVITITGY